MQEWMSCRVLEEYHLISDTICQTGEPPGVYDVTKNPKVELILSHSLNLIFCAI